VGLCGCAYLEDARTDLVANNYVRAGDAAVSTFPLDRLGAVAAYDRARQLRPQDERLRRRLLGRYVNVEAYRRAAVCLPSEPSRDPALALLGGQILLHSNNPQAGLELLKVALQAAGPNTTSRAWIQNNVGYVLADAGYKLQDALRLTEAATRALPGESIVIDSLGWAHYRLGHYEEAAFYLEYSLRHLREPTFAVLECLALVEATGPLLGPQQVQSLPTIEYHLGAAYARLGRVAPARRMLRRSLEHDPQYAPAKRELEGLRFDLPPAWEDERMACALRETVPGRNAP